MGITGELVKSVFSKSRSLGTHDSNMRSSSVERRRWSAVRSYLCGDEFNSVIAEEDSASVRSSKASMFTQPEYSSAYAEDSDSVRSSEATVTQPMLEDSTAKREIREEKSNSASILFRKDDAAIVIQSAFRSFLARRRNGVNLMDDGKQEAVVGTASPSRESVGTSIEVQTGNSTDVFSVREESMAVPHRMQQKARTQTQVWKLKEDWDDSTVSSNISKMRIQNRLEATSRRERALAYAFSQQLRICSKKRQTRSDGSEPNMGWSWLERWMATRQQECSLMDISRQVEQPNGNQRSVVRKRLLFDVAGEEKESCGSNEVSIQFDTISVTKTREKDDFKPMHRLKARSVSRRKTVPSYHYPKDHTKVSKKECLREDESDKKHKPKHIGNKKEVICEDATSQVSLDLAITSNNSELGP